MPGLMDGSLRQLVAAAAETDEQARRLLHIQEAMAGVDVVAGSTDGAVTVHVDRHGAVTDIAFTPEAARLGPRGLRSAVLDAIRLARQRIGPGYADIVRSSGADPDTADLMVGRFRDAHPDWFDPEPAAPSAPPGAPPAADDDEATPLLRRATD